MLRTYLTAVFLIFSCITNATSLSAQHPWPSPRGDGNNSGHSPLEEQKGPATLRHYSTLPLTNGSDTPLILKNDSFFVKANKSTGNLYYYTAPLENQGKLISPESNYAFNSPGLVLGDSVYFVVSQYDSYRINRYDIHGNAVDSTVQDVTQGGEVVIVGLFNVLGYDSIAVITQNSLTIFDKYNLAFAHTYKWDNPWQPHPQQAHSKHGILKAAFTTPNELIVGLQYLVAQISGDWLRKNPGKNIVPNTNDHKYFQIINHENEQIKWIIKDTNSNNFWIGGDYPVCRFAFIDKLDSTNFIHPKINQFAPLAIHDDAYLIAASTTPNVPTMLSLHKGTLAIKDSVKLPNSNWKFTTAPIVTKSDDNGKEYIYITVRETTQTGSDSLVRYTIKDGFFQSEDKHIINVENQIDDGEKPLSLAVDKNKRIYVPTLAGLEIFSEKQQIKSFTKIGGDNQHTGCAGIILDNLLQIKVINQFDEPFENLKINFAVGTNEGRLVKSDQKNGNIVVTTNEQGIAEVGWIPGFYDGQQTVTASVVPGQVDSSPQETFYAIVDQGVLRIKHMDSLYPPNSIIKVGTVFENKEHKSSIEISNQHDGSCVLPRISSLVIKDPSKHNFRFDPDKIRIDYPEPDNLGPNGTPLQFDIIFNTQSHAETQTCEIEIDFLDEDDVPNNNFFLQIEVADTSCKGRFVTETESLIFQAIPPATSVTKEIAFQSNERCSVSDYEITISEGSPFTIVSPNEWTDVPYEGLINVQIEFSPESQGLHADSLVVTYNDGEKFIMPIWGLSLEKPLSFPKTTFIDTETSTIELTNENSDTVFYFITQPSNPVFGFINADDSTIAPQETDTLNFTFSPQVAIQYADSFTITLNGETSTVYLSGQGVEVLKFEPNPLQFISTCVELKSTSSFKVYNQSKQDLASDSVKIFGDSFSADIGTVELAGGENKEFVVDFYPAQSGWHDGRLQVFYNESLNSNLNLRGVGETALMATNLDSVVFEKRCETTRLEKELILTRFGKCTLEFKNISIEGEHWWDFKLQPNPDSLDFPILIEDSISFEIIYKPNNNYVASRAELKLELSHGENKIIPLRGMNEFDLTAHPKPDEFQVIPDKWSDSSFVVQWRKKEDNLAKAYFYFEDADITYDIPSGSIKITEDNLYQRIEGIIPPEEGLNPFKFWLADQCENADRDSSISGEMKYDTTNAVIQVDAPPIASVSEYVQIKIKASDSISGIKSVHYNSWPGGTTDLFDRGHLIQSSDTTETLPATGLVYMITVTDNAGNQSVGKNSILPKIDQNFFQVDLKDYRIVSTPFYPEGGRFLDEIKLTNGENPRNKNEFHVWQITSQSAMASNPFGDFTFSDSLSPGQAILIRTKSATNINVKPGARVAIHNVFQIPLHPGWNLIGNPFLFKMHIQNIRPIELVNQTFKLRKGFDKPGAGHRIDQFDGLLLWAFPDDTLLSFLPDSNKVDSTLAGFLVNPTNTDTTYIGFSADTTQYNLAITAVSGDHSDTIFLGLKDDSKTEWDPYDMIDPPSLNSTVQIYFDHLEWVGHEGNYSQDIHRFPIENTGQWRFKIFSKENVGKLHLKFKASPDLLNEFRIQLFSNQDNSTYTTIPSIEYVYNCTPLEIQQSTQSALSFIIILDEESQKKSAKQHKQNIEADAVTFSSYPNPFESVTSFRIQIQNEMFLSLQIHDLNGRLIRSFFDKKYFSSGVHDSLWDGRDSHGMMVSSGIYMARLITEKNQVFVQKITHIK